MKLFSRKPKALVASPDVVDSVVNRQANMLIPLGGGSSQLINATYMRGQSCTYGWLYKHRPAVRIVVDYIASQVSQLPLKLYERLDDDDRERNTDHPGAQTMARPDGGQTPTEQFIFSVIADWLVYNRVIILKLREGGSGPLTLIRWPSPLALVAGDKRAEMYRLIRTDGSWFEAPPEDIIDWHGYNPDDALMGYSKLETLRDSLTEDQVSQAAIVELMRAGLKGGHIERPLDAPEWSETAMMRFLESWVNQRRSPGKDPLLEDGMTWVHDAITPKDAELLAGRRFTVEEVAMTYGCPPEVLGLAGGEGSQDLAEAEQQVNVDLLPPLIGMLSGQLNQDILEAEYFASDFFYEFDMNARLRGDPVARFAAITSAIGRPWRTVNEGRRLDNLPPIKGGDELTIPLNVALGELPAPNVMPPQNPNGPPADGTNPTAPTQQDAKPKAIAPVQIARPALPAVEVGHDLVLMGKAAADPVTQLVPRRKADLGRQGRYTSEVIALIDHHYSRVEHLLLGKKAQRKAVGFDLDRWNRELGADLYRLLTSIVEREAGIYVARLAGDDFDMRYVEHYLAAMAKGSASALNEVTVQDIEDLGPKDGLDHARTVIGPLAAANLGARSTIWARTEAAKQAPHYELRTKTWIADTERHAEFDGDQVPIGEDWPAGFAPGSAPNCGCSAGID